MASGRDFFFAALTFAVCLFAFRHAPVQQGGGDSRYTMLLSENLLRQRDFALDRYHLPADDYRLETAGGHRYDLFPPGSAILSVPYVALMHLHGESAVRPDGSYDHGQELRLEARLAAYLMAAFAALVFLTSRLLLPAPRSLLLAAAIAFGTQILSTTSRALWSDTWGVLLVGVAAFRLLRGAARDEEPNPFLVGTLLAWAYVVRPTNSLALAGTAIYLAATARRIPWRFLVTAAAWLALFVAYSWRHFHQLLPSYFQAGRLGFRTGLDGLVGNLVSPSRGLLVCVPLTVAVGVWLVRYRAALRFRPLAWLALAIGGAHLVALSGFGHWWGGHCFGARLTASLLPWIVVLAVLAVDARRRALAARPARAADGACLIAAALLSIASVLINAAGALSPATAAWNTTPNIDRTPERLWSWRRCQPLAPLTAPEPPR